MLRATDGVAGLGYLLKERVSELSELVRALHDVARGGSALDPKVVEGLMSRTTQQTPSALASLTERELDVLRLVARGRSNAEIGQELFISETTVKTHITHILRKLNLRDRVQAVVLVHDTGLFEEKRVRR